MNMVPDLCHAQLTATEKWSTCKLEFHQEFNGHGTRHVTCVHYVSDTCFSFQYSILLTFNQIKLQVKCLHVNWSEFYQEFNGHGHRYLTCVCHVTPVCHMLERVRIKMQQCNISNMALLDWTRGMS